MAADLSRQVGDHLYNVLVLNISCVLRLSAAGAEI
jgi:hypothetical protein